MPGFSYFVANVSKKIQIEAGLMTPITYLLMVELLLKYELKQSAGVSGLQALSRVTDGLSQRRASEINCN